MPVYAFSKDYVTGFLPAWKRCLTEMRGREGVRMLEIGSFEGRSAIWFLENILTGAGSSITCVDGFWPPYGEVFDRNIAASGMAARVIKLAGDSRRILPTLTDSFDVIYIDAGHSEEDVRDDAAESWRLSKAGTIFLFDDYGWGPELPLEQRPKRAIERFLLKNVRNLQVLERGYQIILKRTS